MPGILQSQFTEKGLKKTENSEHNVVLMLFLSLLLFSKTVDPFFLNSGGENTDFQTFHVSVTPSKYVATDQSSSRT